MQYEQNSLPRKDREAGKIQEILMRSEREWLALAIYETSDLVRQVCYSTALIVGKEQVVWNEIMVRE